MHKNFYIDGSSTAGIGFASTSEGLAPHFLAVLRSDSIKCCQYSEKEIAFVVQKPWQEQSTNVPY
jgi:hypothetical protein